MAEENQTDEAKAAAADKEAKRRAKLSPEQRDLEDRAAKNGLSVEDQAELDKLEAEEAAKSNPQARIQALRAKQIAGQKAARDKQATIEAIVAPGRSVFTEHGQTEPHGPGAKIMLTPVEYAKLVALGHVRDPNGELVERSGPKVLEDAGLIRGHSAGQGQQPAK
jgi:hypothetical protein